MFSFTRRKNTPVRQLGIVFQQTSRYSCKSVRRIVQFCSRIRVCFCDIRWRTNRKNTAPNISPTNYVHHRYVPTRKRSFPGEIAIQRSDTISILPRIWTSSYSNPYSLLWDSKNRLNSSKWNFPLSRTACKTKQHVIALIITI